MPPAKPPYELTLEPKHWDAIERLPRQSQRENVLNFLMTYAIYTPRKPRPPHLKELKNAQKGMWQYDIDREYRLIYTVDEPAKVVTVIYIGFHPDWSNSDRGRRIRT